ncbi:MAG: hypothetical protein ABH950_02470 [Candidatus Altiarchaeota archaeon]
MAKDELGELGKWLSITDQQVNVLKTIYKLESKKERPSPKNIAKTFKTDFGIYIQKPNLFVILKTLMGEKLVYRKELSDYRISFEGLNENFSSYRNTLEEEITKFDLISPKIEEYFKKATYTQSRAQVAALTYKEFYDHLTERMKNAKTFLSASSFPIPAYTQQVAAGLGKTEFQQILATKCFKEKTLEIHYVTDLNVDYLFNHCFRVLGDPVIALKEANLIIEQLHTQVLSQKNLHIHTIDDLHGLDVDIPLEKDPLDFYLVTRDEHADIAGAIYIKNPETAENAHKQFHQHYDYADDLAEKHGKKTIKEKKAELKDKYGALEETEN